MISFAPLNKMLFSTGTTTANVAGSETPSEISSVDSDWSDIKSIAIKLGVQNVDDLHTERFKVDRQKLETMITTDSGVEGLNSAEYFFENIMKMSETYISWPCRLKIGAKSKKDPHVRIVGKPVEVNRAKELILANLDARGTRVIMKMDIPYTDHSFIIGRRGNNIKRIMDSTATHIHFPDSNRSNPNEKSNQVSLCGSLEGVERARTMVRLSAPLLISFQLPIMGPGQLAPDHDTPYISMIEMKFNVQVIFSSRTKLHSSLVLVKGSESDALRVQEATQALIKFTCDNIANQIQVHMHLEISPQHHEIVKGRNNINLLGIMERTKTKIIFPDLTDMNVTLLKKSQVTISGTIDGVYKARQQLIGNLPVVLIFDFPDNQNDASEIFNISTKYGVYITLRQKQNQSTLAIVIKGVEKFIDKIYEARHEVLRLKTNLIKADIPITYFAPNDNSIDRNQLTQLLAGSSDNWPKVANQTSQSINAQFGKIGNLTNKNCNQNAMGNGNTGNNSNNNQKNCGGNSTDNNTSNNNSPNAIANNNLFTNNYPTTPTGICAPTHKFLQVHNNNFNRINNFLQPAPPPMQMPSGSNVSPRNSLHNTSGYQSFSSSTTSLEQSYPPFGPQSGHNARGHYSPDSTYSSEAGCRAGRRSSDGILLGIGGAASSTSEAYRYHYDVKQNRVFDFEYKRVMGLKAMERPLASGEIRTPNANWIGLSLSRTSPSPLESVDDIGWNRSNGYGGTGPISPYTLGTTTGLMDSTPTNHRLNLTQHKDIHSLLISLGLEHYIKILVLNEIDLEMFTTLTEDNLIELGITAFGARKKLLVAIHTLQASDVASSSNASASSPRFSGSAAPGAERRSTNAW